MHKPTEFQPFRMKINMRNLFYFLLLAVFVYQCKPNNGAVVTKEPQPTKMELKNENGKYQLYLNGEPFWINGAGLEFGNIEKLAEHGGNSFCTWRTDNGRKTGKEVLDEAHKNGLYVTMGINVEKERHGFDYDDEAAVADQFERIKKEVMMYKGHPALIIWAIGNELNHHATNPKVWDAVNQISKYIHEVDPHHLTTTTTAGLHKELVDQIKERASDIDLLSVQFYADVVNLPKYIEETGWDGAYMVTKWGATGHWEIGRTAWDKPIEINSSIKADLYLERFRMAIEPYKDQCVGSYVFLWGQKQVRTPTWYGMFLPTGEETESVDVMHYIWKGEWPSNRTPRFEDVKLDGKTAYEDVYLEPSKSYQVKASITDPDGDKITYIWDVKPESTDLGDGSDREPVPQSIPDLIEGKGAEVLMTAPAKEGAYRLFLYALDGQGHGAHVNVPFFVKNKELTKGGGDRRSYKPLTIATTVK